MKRHISYANVAATLALVFSMAGGALAASHYIITSASQIKPSVLTQLRGRPRAGPTGAAGPEGKAGPAGKSTVSESFNVPGPPGPQGVEGQRGPVGPAGVYEGPKRVFWGDYSHGAYAWQAEVSEGEKLYACVAEAGCKASPLTLEEQGSATWATVPKIVIGRGPTGPVGATGPTGPTGERGAT